MAPPIRLFLADVDGTLVTQDKILTDRAIAAVAKLKEAGILFAVTSGRPPRGMSMLIEPLQLATPIAGFNGGVYVHPDMSVIEQQTIPDDVDLVVGTGNLRWKRAYSDMQVPLDVWYPRDVDGPMLSGNALIGQNGHVTEIPAPDSEAST